MKNYFGKRNGSNETAYKTYKNLFEAIKRCPSLAKNIPNGIDTI